MVWAADYLPFGQADVTINTIENNLRFSGQYYDSETGLHYNYWRFYDPELGRYLRADPIGLDGGINLYVYVENNPVNAIDPYGLLFGFNAGESYGESAAMYYANITIDPSASRLAKIGAWTGGLFASLWTPETSNGTAVVLATAGVGTYGRGLAVAGEYALTGAYYLYGTVGASAWVTAYYIAPYSEAIVDFTYGLFTETGPPQGWGYLGSGGMFVYQKLKEYLDNKENSNCE